MSDKGDIINREETVNEGVGTNDEALQLEDFKEDEMIDFEKFMEESMARQRVWDEQFRLLQRRLDEIDKRSVMAVRNLKTRVKEECKYSNDDFLDNQVNPVIEQVKAKMEIITCSEESNLERITDLEKRADKAVGTFTDVHNQLSELSSRLVMQDNEIDKLKEDIRESLDANTHDKDKEVSSSDEAIKDSTKSVKKGKKKSNAEQQEEKLAKRRKSMLLVPGGGDDPSSDSASSDEDEKPKKKKAPDKRRGKNKDYSSESTPTESSSDEDDRSKKKKRSKVIKDVTPASYPTKSFPDPRNVEKLIESFEQYDTITERHPEADLKMIDFMSTKSRDLIEAHGKIMGVIDTANHRKNTLAQLSDNKVRKILYDMNKGKSYSDMVAKIKRITFLKDGGKFTLGKDNWPEFYNELVLFNNRFTKILDLYGQCTDPKFIPGLRKQDKVKGIMDYYFAAIPSGAAIQEQMSNEGLIKPSFKRSIHVASATLKYVKAKRDVAMSYRDLGRICAPERTEKTSEERNASMPARKRFPFNRRPGQRVNALEGRAEDGFEDDYDNKTTPEEKEEYDRDDYKDDIPDYDAEQEFDLGDVYGGEDEFDEVNKDFFRGTEEEFNAMQGRPSQDARKGEPVKGCYKFFNNNKCDDPNCKFDHTEKGMFEVAINKLAELLKSKHAPDKAYIPKMLEKAGVRAAEMKLNEAKLKGSPPAKPGVRA